MKNKRGRSPDNANSKLIQLINKQRHEHKDDLARREKGHLAIITMKIDIRPMNADNTFERYMLGNRDLERYGMSNKAQITVKGSSEADCVKKVKEVIERMNINE